MDYIWTGCHPIFLSGVVMFRRPRNPTKGTPAVSLGVVSGSMQERVLRSGRPAICAAVATLLVAVYPLQSADGYTPDSREVRALIDKGLAYLEKKSRSDERLGAKALAGLAFLKNDAPRDHPRVVYAVSEIQRALSGRDPEKLDRSVFDIYSTGLAGIFLTTLDPVEYSSEVESLLDALRQWQKDCGGWGYKQLSTGDTSMTQYGTLCVWEAAQAGLAVPPEMIDRAAIWLLSTRDPSGAFGYQGTVSPSSLPVAQSNIRFSMTIAAASSMYICADLLGLSTAMEEPQGDLPPALKKIETHDGQREGAVQATKRLDVRLFREAQAHTNKWIQANYRSDPSTYPYSTYIYYNLYTVERYMSFSELAEERTVISYLCDTSVRSLSIFRTCVIPAYVLSLYFVPV